MYGIFFIEEIQKAKHMRVSVLGSYILLTWNDLIVYMHICVCLIFNICTILLNICLESVNYYFYIRTSVANETFKKVK